MRLNSASILGERAYRIFLSGAVSAGHKKCPMVGRDESEVFIKYKRGNVHRQSAVCGLPVHRLQCIW